MVPVLGSHARVLFLGINAKVRPREEVEVESSLVSASKSYHGYMRREHGILSIRIAIIDIAKKPMRERRLDGHPPTASGDNCMPFVMIILKNNVHSREYSREIVYVR